MINITIIYNSDVIIEFKYNKTIVEKVKELPIKVYMPNEKCWWIPLHLLDDFIDSIRGFPYVVKQINLAENKELAETFKFKTEPFKHQIEGFEYGKNRERFLLGDEQGLGKTKQSIDIAVYKKLLYNFKHCLVIVGVKTLIYNWGREIKLHSNEDFHILGEYKNKKDKVISGGTTYKITDLDDIDNLPYFLITNVESIRNKEISNKLIELIDTSEIGMIIFDEFHKVKNAQSQQGAALLKLKPITRIAMTGTPLLNNPLELFPVLNWLDIERHSFYQFRAHYAELGNFKQILRYKNLDELNKILTSVMLRRKKKDVLDLPPKLYTTEYLEMGKEQTAIYEEVKEEIVKNIDKIELTNNPLTELIRLRQATGFTGILSTTVRESIKYDRVMEIVEDVVSNDGKLILYSQWVEILKPLYRVLENEGYNPALIIGGVDKQAQEMKYKEDDTCNVLLGTIGSLGTGLTFTNTNTIVFLDEPWNRPTKEQAEDRAHRIGTTGTVNIITLVNRNTIDERITEIIYQKGLLSDSIVDSQMEKLDRGSLLRYLLG